MARNVPLTNYEFTMDEPVKDTV
ncbi:putative membrane protein, partial [Plasmodium reichenowi]